MQDEHGHGGGGASPPNQSTPAKSGDAVEGSQVTGVVSGASHPATSVETAKIRILRRIVDELHDSINHHKRAADAYFEALRRLRSEPPDRDGATAKITEGDGEARTAHDIDERVKGKEEALGAID